MRIFIEDIASMDFELPVTRFFITDTEELNSMVDAKRKEMGYPTFFDDTNPDNFYDGWYDFYADVDLETNTCLEFGVTVIGDEDIEDNERHYDFEILDIEVDYDDVFRQISEQIDINEVYETAMELQEK